MIGEIRSAGSVKVAIKSEMGRIRAVRSVRVELQSSFDSLFGGKDIKSGGRYAKGVVLNGKEKPAAADGGNLRADGRAVVYRVYPDASAGDEPVDRE